MKLLFPRLLGIAVFAAVALGQPIHARAARCHGAVNDYIAVFSAGERGPAAAAAVAKRYDGQVLHVYQHAVNGFLVRMSECGAEAMRADRRIARVERDVLVGAKATAVQTGSAVYWGLDRIDQRSGTDNSYTYNATGAGVRVYVLDSGISDNTDSIAVNGYTCCTVPDFGGGWTTTPDYSDVYCQTIDAECHGTKVANIIGGWLYGVAKSATLINVRVIRLGSNGQYYNNDITHASDIMGGLDWAVGDHQAHPTQPAVMNISLDWSKNQDVVPSGNCPSCGPALEQAVINAIDSGIVVVCGAGNWNSVGPFYGATDAYGSMPARLGSLDGSAMDNLNNPHNRTTITVSASDQSDAPARNQLYGYDNYGNGLYWTANTGPAVDIFAPGAAVQSRGTQSPDSFSGTSAASPYVAGVVALYLQGKGSNYDPNAVEDVLKRNATVMPNFSKLVYSRVDLWQP